MNILIVDDDQTRHDMAEDLFTAAGHVVLHAFSCDEGKEILQAGTVRIGLLMLDHDLGVDGSGEDVAKFIVNELDPSYYPAQAVSHSWGGKGAAIIRSWLTAAKIPTQEWPFDRDLVKYMIKKLVPQ
jgi:hypothetical protein